MEKHCTVIKEVDKYYLNQEEPNRGCLLALRKMILDQDDLVTETRKYGMPCFCYKNKMFTYLWTDKSTGHPYILFVEGAMLHHPELESGTRKRMKIFQVNPNEDLPIETINTLLKSSLDLYRDGHLKSK